MSDKNPKKLLSLKQIEARSLNNLHLCPLAIGENATILSPIVRETFQVSRFPRNVHPQYNVARCKVRAISLIDFTHKSLQITTYVDVAQYGHTDSFVAVVADPHGKILNAASVRHTMVAAAEQVAVALAMNDPSWPYIYTDSKSAMRAFLSGLISKEAVAIIKQIPPDAFHTIAWLPAHMGTNVRTFQQTQPE